jgi:hypothetical protein
MGTGIEVFEGDSLGYYCVETLLIQGFMVFWFREEICWRERTLMDC